MLKTFKTLVCVCHPYQLPFESMAVLAPCGMLDNIWPLMVSRSWSLALADVILYGKDCICDEGSWEGRWSGWALNATIHALMRRGQKPITHRKGEDRVILEVEMGWCGHQKLDEKGTDYPVEPLERGQPASTLILVRWNCFWTSGLQNCNRINCYSKHQMCDNLS